MIRSNFTNNNINFQGLNVSKLAQKPMSPLLLNKINSLKPGLKKDEFEKQEQKETIQSSNYLSKTLYKPQLPSSNKLSIYYYNDTHGNSDLVAGIVNSAKAFRNNCEKENKNYLILSGGDNCSGANEKKNEYMFDLMKNDIKVDASAAGNHELDGGMEGFLEAIKESKVPFIITNASFDNEELSSHVEKSRIIEKDGVKYGLVGTMPIDFKTCTKEEVQEGVNVQDFEGTVESLQEEINNLKEQKVDRILMLSHVGYETDKKLVSQLDGVDAVISGHSHTVVEGVKEGENLLKSKSNEPVIIVQAGENGRYFGILELEFDNKGIITKVANKLTRSDNTEKSPILEKIKEGKMGASPKIGSLVEVDPLPENRRIEPCGWTCTMADSMKEELGVEIAIINSANIRKVPKRGTLTHRDVVESAPMKNNLIKTKLTQKQLVEAVKNAAKTTFSTETGEPGLLQGSGFGYKIDDKGNLLEMYLIDKNNNKTPIDINNPSDEITYTAAIDSFTAKKDGETPELHPKFETEVLDFDKDQTMIDYLSKLPDSNNIKIKYDNRIEIVKT